MTRETPRLFRTDAFSYWLYPSQRFWVNELVPRGAYHLRGITLMYV